MKWIIDKGIRKEKVFFLMAWPLRGLGWGKGHKEKEHFLKLTFDQKKVSMATKLEGGWGLSGWATKRKTFFSASLRWVQLRVAH